MENSEKKRWSMKKKIIVTGAALLALSGTANALGGETPETNSSIRSQEQSVPVKKAEPKVTTEEKSEVSSLPYQTVIQDDGSLASGQTRVAQDGIDGSKTVTYEITYSDGVQTSMRQVGEPVIVAPVNKIVKNGTYTAPAAASAYYPNCSAARAAGVAPIYAGEPGYASKLDRDGDGIACE